MIQGTLTALITPFQDGQVDVETLRALVERQIASGIHGLVACGTTGEAAAMSPEENLLTIRHVVEQARGRVPVVAGTGSHSTRHSVEMTRRAASLKVDAALVVTPYYVKPPQRGLLEHFRQVAQVGIPVVAYNVPSRTGVSLTVGTATSLAAMDNVVALKEASADLALGAQIIATAGDALRVLSGDDATYLPLLAVGGAGCICVTSNVAPAEMAGIFDHARAGRLEEARALHHRMLPLMKGLFVESNPIPVKAAMAMLGLCTPEIRTPLAPLADELRPKLNSLLTASGIAGGDK